jgi:hypothetical protein
VTRWFGASPRRSVKRVLSLTGWTLGAVVFSQGILYRLILGVPVRDPHAMPDGLSEAAVCAAFVLAVVSGLCGTHPKLSWAVAGAAWGAAVVVAHHILHDWLSVGWGGEVGHDVWFGEPVYWLGCAYLLAFATVCFSIGAAAVWAGRRGIERLKRHP